uniref:Putative secreted protein n=1 Tax=Anopheles darlingi TaxID=43151 RepID=A0A2M4DFT2_ANODA
MLTTSSFISGTTGLGNSFFCFFFCFFSFDGCFALPSGKLTLSTTGSEDTFVTDTTSEIGSSDACGLVVNTILCANVLKVLDELSSSYSSSAHELLISTRFFVVLL